MPAVPAQLPGFRHAMVETGTGVRYHTVIGGSGAPVILLHGFPQTWWEWRHIMPPLARSRTVVAVDLKGGGYSDKPATGYEKTAMGRDLEEVRRALGLSPVAVVGHDIAGMVAYAWAAAHPGSVDRLAVIDVAIPGTTAPGMPRAACRPAVAAAAANTIVGPLAVVGEGRTVDLT